MGGLYDILESYRDQQNRLNYEGLYEEPADTSINLDPMYNIGARQFGDMRMGMPQVQATGIMQQAPQGIFNDYYGPNIDTSFGVANEEDEEQGSSFRDSLSGMGKKFGLSSLIGLITGNPILGLIGKGMGALANRAGPGFSDFKNASTGAQFFQNLRDRRARNDAAARGLAKQQEIARQTAIQAMTTNQAYGGGGGGGGIGSSVGGSASPGSAGPGGSDSMGSF
jgi:hypothetical protein